MANPSHALIGLLTYDIVTVLSRSFLSGSAHGKRFHKVPFSLPPSRLALLSRSEFSLPPPILSRGRRCSEVSDDRVQAQTIAFGPKARNLPDRNGGNVRVVAEGFALMNIAEVDFDGGKGDGSDRITNGNAGVGIGSGINQQSIKYAKSVLNRIDQNTLMI